MSRHRQGAELHWSRDQFADKATMTHQLGRDGRKDLAHDYAKQQGIEPTGPITQRDRDQARSRSSGQAGAHQHQHEQTHSRGMSR